MAERSSNRGLLLGKQVPSAAHYSPELLYPIARSEARATLGLHGDLPFNGEDIWHAYEMSWLNANGKPQVYVGRFSVPAHSANIIESKSFKLYLGSLNNHRFESQQAAIARIVADVSAAAGEAVDLQLFALEDERLAGAVPAGQCIDGEIIGAIASQPSRSQLSCVAAGESVDEILYSHLLRSLCPVTGQPDWASLVLRYRGSALDRPALLGYLLTYREHQEFHEQCVERIFCDISAVCRPESLQVQAFYTRRGGMDINPYRSSETGRAPLFRLNRQ